MLFLVRNITLRHISRHPLRTLLTCLGILLGTAVAVGVGLLNESTLASFQDMLHGVAGKSDLTVTSPGRGGLPPETLDVVAGVPGVRAATPTVRVPGYLSDHPAESILVLGIDALADKEFRTLKVAEEQELDPLAFLNSPESILVPRSLAERNGIKKDDVLWVTIHGEKQRFVVSAVVAEEGPAKVYGGNVLIVDIFAAEERLGRQGAVDQIDILALPGVSQAELSRAVAGALGPGVVVEQAERNRQAEKMIDGLRRIVSLVSALAVFVGMFLIYNTFNTAVAQRRREIGMLRAMGTSRGEIAALFLGEAFVIGLLGSLLGVAAGTVLAKLLMQQYSQTVNTLYFKVHVETIHFSLPAVLQAVAMGTGAALLSAWLPARAAAAVSPLEALSKARAADDDRRRSRVLFAGGVFLLAAVFLYLKFGVASSQVVIGIAAACVAFFALALLSPFLIEHATAALRPLYRGLGLESRIGGDNLGRNANRTAVTISALLIGITLAVTMAGAFSSVATSVEEWIESSIAVDLSVRGSVAMPGMNSIELPAALGDDLRKVEGVADVGLFRMNPASSSAGPLQVIGLNVEAFDAHSALRWVEGEAHAGYAALRDGTQAVVSENFSLKHGVHRGDTVTVDTVSGPRSFTIIGVIVDYTSDLGTMVVDRKAYIAMFNDTAVDAFDVWVKPGFDPVTVRENIRRAYPEKQLFIQTNTEFRKEVSKALGQIFGMTDLVQVLVIIIAVIGIINTMLINILDRTRELGMLRAVGFTGGQLGAMLLWEAAFMGIIAGILGSLMGAGFATEIFPLIRKQLVGWSTEVVVPWRTMGLGFVVAAVSAFVAGLYPARKAAKIEIMSALTYE